MIDQRHRMKRIKELGLKPDASDKELKVAEEKNATRLLSKLRGY
ncbi:MAG: hypothetical protein ACJ72Q_11715 [Nitrososphaeraceae archaeon]